MIFLQPVTHATALMFKEVRLHALQDSPLAFSSTYAKEAALADEEWIKRAERWDGHAAILYMAFDDADLKQACGIVACYAENKDAAPHGHVISMWVDPQYRRAGVGAMLIDALKTWARARGLRALTLMVTSVNTAAIEFYRRIGFRMSGTTAPYPNDPAIIEFEMILPLPG
jgi:ribosomal protein S18 acetylase RimI-like enzyme